MHTSIRAACSVLLVAASALLPSKIWAQSCTLNGHNAPPECSQGYNCGAETGTLICTQLNKPFGEWQIVQGKHVGLEKTYNSQGVRIEQTVDDAGRQDGVFRKYSPQGTLLIETEYDHGKMNGKYYEYFSDGKPERIEWWANGTQKFEVSYTKKGEIAGLTCGKEHYMDEDAALCGFDGKADTVTITEGMNGTKDVTYLNGDLVKTVNHPL